MTGAGDGLEGVVLEGDREEVLVLRGVSAVDDMFANPNATHSRPLERTLLERAPQIR